MAGGCVSGEKKTCVACRRGGVCMAGEVCMVGVCGRGHAWQRACVVGGIACDGGGLQ